MERGLQLSLWAGYVLAFAAAVYAATALSGGSVPATLVGCTAGEGGALGAAGRFLLSLSVRALPAGARSAAAYEQHVVAVGCHLRVLSAMRADWSRLVQAGDPGTLMASSAVLLAGTIAAAALHGALFRLRQRFHVGTWPPPRNRAKK